MRCTSDDVKYTAALTNPTLLVRDATIHSLNALCACDERSRCKGPMLEVNEELLLHSLREKAECGSPVHTFTRREGALDWIAQPGPPFSLVQLHLSGASAVDGYVNILNALVAHNKLQIGSVLVFEDMVNTGDGWWTRGAFAAWKLFSAAQKTGFQSTWLCTGSMPKFLWDRAEDHAAAATRSLTPHAAACRVLSL